MGASVSYRVQARVLLVGPDIAWSRQVGEMLRSNWFAVEVGCDEADALAQVASFEPHVIGVDLLPPGRAVTSLVSAVRGHSPVAIVAFGSPTPEADILDALAAGADTFIFKSASHPQLLARLRALLRRVRQVGPGPGIAPARGPVELDVVGRRASVACEDFDLTDPELDLLEVLLRAPGRAVSREELMGVLKTSKGGELDLHVRRLREKLEARDPQRRVLAVRGVGFRFEPIEVGAR